MAFKGSKYPKKGLFSFENNAVIAICNQYAADPLVTSPRNLFSLITLYKKNVGSKYPSMIQCGFDDEITEYHFRK